MKLTDLIKRFGLIDLAYSLFALCVLVALFSVSTSPSLRPNWGYYRNGKIVWTERRLSSDQIEIRNVLTGRTLLADLGLETDQDSSWFVLTNKEGKFVGSGAMVCRNFYESGQVNWIEGKEVHTYLAKRIDYKDDGAP